MIAIAKRARHLGARLPTDLLGRTRSLFLVFGFLTCAGAVPPLLFAGSGHVGLRALAVVLLTLLSWRWYRWFRSEHVAGIDPLIEVLVLTVLAWALADPSVGLGVFYVGLYYRSLYGGRRHAILGVVIFAGSYFTGIALHEGSLTSLSSTPVLAPVPGFILTGSVMYIIAQSLSAQRRTVEQLADAERRYRILVEHLPIGIYQSAMDGRISYVSPRAREIFGFTEEMLQSKVDWAIESLIHPDDRDRMAIMHHRRLDQEDRTDVEFRMFNGHEEMRWVRVRSLLVRDQAGEPAYWQGTLEDVTDRRHAEAAIYAAEERYRTLVEQLPAVTYISAHDGSGTPSYVSPQIEQMLGIPADAWLRDPTLWISRLHPDDRELVLRALEDAGKTGRYNLEYRTLAGDGRVVWVESIATLVSDAEGNPRYWHGVLIDITPRKEAAAAQRELAAIVTSSQDAITATTLDGTITNWNRGAEALYGYTAGEITGRSIASIMPEDHRSDLPVLTERLRKGESITSFETVRLNKQGQPINVSLTLSPLLDEHGAVVGVSTIARDIRERKRLEAELVHQAFHDSLTGLANRTLFHDRLAHALKRNVGQDKLLAVLFLDLDNFKFINDSLGHEVGDHLLVAAANRFVAHLRPGDTAARLGGDEFTFLLEDLTRPQEAIEVAQRLLSALNSTITIDEQELRVTASIGVAIAGDDAEGPEDLLRHADVAMYHAKHQGKGRVEPYEAAFEAEAWARLRLEQDLRRALERDQFHLVYQPIVRLADERVVAVEALVRWTHPQHGLIMPGQFIALAEETGLILPLGRVVLKIACEQMRRWQEELGDAAPDLLSVNLSVRQVHDPDLVATLSATLRETGLSPDRLALEITETAVMDAKALQTIEELRRLGVFLEIDDFGTGYSSLAYLQKLPVDFVKIDRSFIDGLGRDANDTVITAGIIGLAHGLGMKVIAEGVEQCEQLERLSAMSCDFAQGHYLSYPIGAAELSRLLESGELHFGELPSEPCAEREARLHWSERAGLDGPFTQYPPARSA